jgi:hypothetical protein
MHREANAYRTRLRVRLDEFELHAFRLNYQTQVVFPPAILLKEII